MTDIFLDLILQSVCEVFTLTPEQLKAHNSTVKVSDARDCFCYYARKYTNHTDAEIAGYIHRARPSACQAANRWMYKREQNSFYFQIIDASVNELIKGKIGEITNILPTY